MLFVVVPGSGPGIPCMYESVEVVHRIVLYVFLPIILKIKWAEKSGSILRRIKLHGM